MARTVVCNRVLTIHSRGVANSIGLPTDPPLLLPETQARCNRKCTYEGSHRSRYGLASTQRPMGRID